MDKFTEALTDLIKTTVTADIKATIIKDALPDISADVQEYACETAANEVKSYLKYDLDISDEISSAVDNWLDYNLDVSDQIESAVDDWLQANLDVSDQICKNVDFDMILVNFFATANGRAVLLDTIREGLKRND